MIHKPKGVVIEPQFLDKIRREYTNPKVCYFCKNPKIGKVWNYSTVSTDLNSKPELFDEESESLIYLDKGVHYQSKPVPVSYRAPSEEYDTWFVSVGAGPFSNLSGASDKNPSVIFDHFLRFLNSNSLHKFLDNFVIENSGHFATISKDGFKPYGKWFERNGAYYTTLDFANKLTFDAKAMLKAVLAFFLRPDEFKTEIDRLAKLSDYEIRALCEKNEQTKKILEQIG